MALDMARTPDYVTTQFWQLCCIAPGRGGAGYRLQTLSMAQSFLMQAFKEASVSDERSLDTALIKAFKGNSPQASPMQQAQAGLCLRCRMSHPILRACMKLANLFGSANQFSYRELLPFVLTDDGRQLVVPVSALESAEKPYRVLNDSGEEDAISFVCFSLEALRTYRIDRGDRLSLQNWIYLQTKQNSEIKNYLAEFGFQALSDWALLNRVRVRQLEQMSEQDQALVRVFHAVYRRDRRLNAAVNRCPSPTSAQLQEMNALLGIEAFSDEKDLLKALKQTAGQLRQFDIWRSRQPLEHFDAQSGEYQPRKDLPTTSLDSQTTEEADMLADLHQQLTLALQHSIQTALTAKIAKLTKSKRYRPFSNKFVLGLQHYYRDGLSLKDIAPLLGMSSWDQARRILNPGDFLNQVRQLTLQQMLDQVLTTVQQKGILSESPSPTYLQQLSEQIEAFADREIFEAAVSEMKAGSHRKLDSPYAQALLTILDSAP
ncbi:MAG: hypothetical protein AB8B99_18600 [Phormidesmis sp.]